MHNVYPCWFNLYWDCSDNRCCQFQKASHSVLVYSAVIGIKFITWAGVCYSILLEAVAAHSFGLSYYIQLVN